MIKNITERANPQHSKCENGKILNLNSKCPATKQGKLSSEWELLQHWP